MKVFVHNRRASHDYAFVERFEAGIELKGSEVKSLRNAQASLSEAFIIPRDGELFLHNAHINEYAPAQQFGHRAQRDRKLLLHRRQINKIIGQITRKGMTAVPIKIYLNGQGKIKVDLALATGMKKEDKREALKEKEWKREQHRVLKNTKNS
jgi:SsrA-binding protein